MEVSSIVDVSSFFCFLIEILTRMSTQLWLGECLLAFGLSLKRRKLFWLRFVPSSLLFLALPSFLPNQLQNTWFYLGSFNFLFILLFLLSILLMLFCFRLPLTHAIFLSSAAYAMQNFEYAIKFLIANLFFPEGRNLIYFIIMLIVEILVYAGYYFLFVRRVKEDIAASLDDKKLIAYSLLVVAICMVVGSWTYDMNYSNPATSIYIGISSFTLMLLQFRLFKSSKAEEDQKIVEQLLAYSEKKQKMSSEIVALVNIKAHDLKHQLSRIEHSEGEGKKDYLNDLKKTVELYDAKLETGNDALNIILSEKRLICLSQKISFNCVVDGESLSFMKSSDIASLFGNIVDNAIEAVSSLEPEKRMISLSVAPKEGLLLIHSDNCLPFALKLDEEGIPQTSKEDKLNHGFGIKSIRYIAEKYHGNMTIDLSEGKFNLNILIPLKQG